MLERSRNHDSGKGAPSAELGVAKQDLRPVVREYLENLQAQVNAILKKYSVSTFAELQSLGEEGLDRVDMQDIAQLTELASVIEGIVTSSRMPLGEIESRMSVIFEKYGVSNFSELQDLAERDSHRIDGKDAQNIVMLFRLHCEAVRDSESDERLDSD